MTHAPLRLLHITDTHLFAETDGRLRGVDTYRTLSRVLDHALGDPPSADAILVTGDLAQDETAGAYAHFRALLGERGLPVWCLPGNHDAPRLMAEALAAPPFGQGKVMDAGPWCVLLLDSHVPGEHGGRVSATQLEWLEDALAGHRHRHTLLAIHHHLLPLGSRWLDELALANAAEMLAVIDRAPQVRAVLAGHVHQVSDIQRRGVRYLTTPSTCFQFLPAVDTFAVDTRPPGYRRLTLRADGQLDSEVIWVEPG